MDEVDGMSSGDRGGIQELVGFFAIPEIDQFSILHDLEIAEWILLSEMILI